MTQKQYKLVIVGSGPAGLSAAARAEQLDRSNNTDKPSYILLEGFNSASKTIFDYQKGKYVMAEPDFLPLRSDLDFSAGKRETILGSWSEGLDSAQVNVQYNSEVTGILGQQGGFSVTLAAGETILSEHVIVSIGLQGNPRRLGVEGDTHSRIQYTLSDPDEFKNETIIVVGAGDAAIENALALTKNNKVYIVNRKMEFSRAKEGNLNNVLGALNDKSLAFQCLYGTQIQSLAFDKREEKPIRVTFTTPDGETEIHCDRIIARLGAVPPRRFVESCGIEFPDERPDALPQLSTDYESNVSGLYIIGALAGYPLIKQAMNQGHDVVETIWGNKVQPVEYDLLAKQFALFPVQGSVDEHIERIRENAPILGQINPLLLREVLLESNIHISGESQQFKQGQTAGRESTGSPYLYHDGDYLFRNGDYSNTFYHIVSGSITIRVKNKAGKSVEFFLTQGMYAGEMSLLSGRPRNGDALIGKDTVLVETPRRVMLKILNIYEDIRLSIDWVFITRALQNFFAPGAPTPDIREIAEAVELKKYNKGETIYQQGDIADRLYLIRSGTVGQSLDKNGELVVLSQAKVGQVIGEMAMMGQPFRTEAALALTQVDTIEIDKERLDKLVHLDASALDRISGEASLRLLKNSELGALPEQSSLLKFLLDNGLGEATNALVINENLCIGCDNCETACAETHNGIARLDRKNAVGYKNWQLPISCRHCETPHCMKDCPPNAIQRESTGEVVILDSCIGCGNCESNCPYDAITLSYPVKRKGSFLSWFLTGFGDKPGQRTAVLTEKDKEKGKKSMKCDACQSNPGGAACVRACPTGAAQRISPDEFVQLIELK